MLSDSEIAQKTEMLPITDIAASIGIKEEELVLYGKYKAKVRTNIMDRIMDRLRQNILM